MKRLILFSGGIESTAMMVIKDEADVVITIEDESPNEMPTFKRYAVDSISKVMNFDVNYCKIQIPSERPTEHFVYQLWTFVSIASLWVNRDTSIKEVWYGLNSNEPYQPCMEQFERIVKGWEAMHPNVKLVFPLRAMTREQQWRIIPDNIKLLVRNCMFNKNCRQCRKCVELMTFKGSFYTELAQG